MIYLLIYAIMGLICSAIMAKIMIKGCYLVNPIILGLCFVWWPIVLPYIIYNWIRSKL
jgi:hypothetical protein